MRAGGGPGKPRVLPSDKLLYYVDDDLVPIRMSDRCRHLECAKAVLLDELLLAYRYLQFAELAEAFMEWKRS